MATAEKLITLTGPRKSRGKNTDHTVAVPSRSELNAVIADTYAHLVLHWHAEFRPKHFTQGAYREYDYAPRSKKYTRRKYKKYGHRNPLEFTGTSKQISESYRLHKTRNGASVAMQVRAFNRRPSGFTGSMSREFRQTSERELRAYGVLARRYLKQRLKGHQVTIQVKL